MSTTLLQAGRITAAPISWGVCEAPGWGLMLDVDRVLGEMKSLGLSTTELGAPGFFPDATSDVAAKLVEHGFSLSGGFVPLVLHDPALHAEAVAEARGIAERFAQLGARFFVTAVVRDAAWSRPERVTDADVAAIATGLGLIDAVCAEHGLIQVIHPHFDTMIETDDEIERVLQASTTRWCLDTGHMTLGGCDPVAFAQRYADRIALVHLKDVDPAVAVQARRRELSLLRAVQAGLFPPLGQGCVPVAEVITVLEDRGYQGLYVLEQDVAITEGEPAPGEGPIEGVRQTLAYLQAHGLA